jgi:hypothetical protein
MATKVLVRMPDELKASLEQAAQERGTSVTAEIVARLEATVAQDSADARLGQALAMVAQAAGEAASRHVEGRRSWTDDPWAYHQVCFAVMELLRRLAPKGPIVRPEPSPSLIEALVEDGADPEQARRLAEGVTDRGPSVHTVDYLTSQGRGDFYAGARAFQEKLGPKWSSRLKGEKGK